MKLKLKTKENVSRDIGTWMPGGNLSATSLKDLCTYTTIRLNTNTNSSTYHQNVIPCLLEQNYSLCIIPAYSDFTLYGALIKYDRHYFITGKGVSIVFEGDESSFFGYQDNYWSLRSNVHLEFCLYQNAFLPIGRMHCNHSVTNENVLLALSKCNYNEFGCSNGECVSGFARCNSIVECEDQSDEEQCNTVEKKKGYNKKRLPHTGKDHSPFYIKYFASVYNIADINSVERIAVVDMFISFLWRDPRLIFWNPTINEEVDCSEIWSPLMAMADGYPNGFKITFKSYRSSCLVQSVFSDVNATKKWSFEEPYMGRFIL